MICGKELENGKCICDVCKASTDIEQLCDEIIRYTPRIVDNPNANPIWEKASEFLDIRDKFKKYAFVLADELPSPRREYQKIHSAAGEYSSLSRADKAWFYEIYPTIDFDALSEWERYRIKGLMLEALFMDYRYDEAEDLAADLVEMVELPWQAASVVADFYNKTRRYDAAEQVIANIAPRYEDDRQAISKFNDLMATCLKYRTASENGKREYMPNPRENKEKAIESYKTFMSSIGIDVKEKPKTPVPIPKDEYPAPTIISAADFDSFVAFDFETTGFSSAADCIIEVGAVKVIGGKVVESKEFIFSEFVKPYKKSLSQRVTEITGITKENLVDARPMWEVIPDFMEFVGDNILLGHNNAAFDSKFLVRAGRYSNIIIENSQFDVLQYIRKIKDKIGYDKENVQLNTLAEFCGVENPAAHRAWADALTTAKVYLILREMV